MLEASSTRRGGARRSSGEKRNGERSMKVWLFLLLPAVGVPSPAPAAQASAAVAVAAISVPAAADSPAVASADASAAAVATLRADLDRYIQQVGWRNDQWGVMVVSLTRGDTLYAREADTPLAPASNMKLFTTAAALYYLGPRFRYNTFLLADGPITNGVLEGDLVLYGTGDPTFSDRFGSRTSVFHAFADTLLAHGIHAIRGSVVGDASYFTGSGTGHGWQTNYIDAAYAAPASALSFAENIATIRVEPASQAGWRPTVRLIPGGEGIAIVNQASTVASGRTSIRAARSDYGGPLVVSGRISRSSRGITRAVPVSDPARYAAAVLREILTERGIAVNDEVRAVHEAGASPVTGRSVFAPALDRRQPLRVLAVHESPPLLAILDVINRRSQNLYAEQALRTLGRVTTGVGSADGGARAIRHFVHEAGLDTTTLVIHDGSGLSPLNRVSARGVVQLLDYMAGSTMADAYFGTLPEAGAQNGIRRMQRTPAEGNLRAKTGTLARVSALSGYVVAANGERLAFSILANNVPSTWQAKRVEDAIGARLARFERPVLEPGAEVGSGSDLVGSAAGAQAAGHEGEAATQLEEGHGAQGPGGGLVSLPADLGHDKDMAGLVFGVKDEVPPAVMPGGVLLAGIGDPGPAAFVDERSHRFSHPLVSSARTAH